MQELLTAIQDNPVAEALRYSRWTYACANAGHIVGVALLFGAILPLDLRLSGLWPTIAVANLARVLVPIAKTGLGLTLITGPLLFSVDPLKYADLWLFRLKLVLIAAAVTNLWLILRSQAWQDVVRDSPGNGESPVPAMLRVAGLVSAILWLLAILCGRFIAYV